MVEDRPAGLRIAADIGGTFTDLVAASGAGACLVHKIASTPAAPEQAVIAGIADVLRMAGATAGDVVEVLHGTTVGSNAILERKGARAGLLTTRGFRDVLEIGRLRTPELYDLAWDKPAPLIPRRHRLEVEERIGGQGEVVRALDPSSVVAAAERLLAAGIESLAVCFINSYRNPAHEEQAVALLRSRYPELDVSASFEILPQIKEYERTSTVAVNAYLRPVLRRYLERLADGLAELGIRAPLLVVTSNGGMAGVRSAVARPVFFVGSGPAAGVVGAAGLGRSLGEPDLIAFDMGGTTAKASLVAGGEVSRVQEYEFRDGISSPSRFIKAGGYMLKVPAIDIAEVGAGGGSLATVDPGGLLKVGPHSAGAAPGPACYGLGGERPTVTDANVVLGYLNPDFLAGGSLALDPARAERAVERELARPLGVSVLEAAFGVRAVVNANMARAIRAVTVERGLDPRDFTLVAFGGGGPVHAADLAAMLGIRRILLPSFPGVFTALGMLTGDVQLEFVRALVARLDELDHGRANALLGELGREAAMALATEGFPAGRQEIAFEADLRFAGQDSELVIPLAGGRIDEAISADLRTRFLAAYETLFQYTTADPVELVNLRVIGRGLRAGRLDFGRQSAAPARRPATGERRVLFDRASGPVTVPVIERSALLEGRRAGPLIVESLDTTIAAPPGASLRGDAAGNLVMELAP
jgi:N-methylhydantoinase A